jgi:hypothetical protein
LWCDPETDRDVVAKDSGRRFEMHRQPLADGPNHRCDEDVRELIEEGVH